MDKVVKAGYAHILGVFVAGMGYNNNEILLTFTMNTSWTSKFCLLSEPCIGNQSMWLHSSDHIDQNHLFICPTRLPVNFVDFV